MIDTQKAHNFELGKEIPRPRARKYFAGSVMGVQEVFQAMTDYDKSATRKGLAASSLPYAARKAQLGMIRWLADRECLHTPNEDMLRDAWQGIEGGGKQSPTTNTIHLMVHLR